MLEFLIEFIIKFIIEFFIVFVLEFINIEYLFEFMIVLGNIRESSFCWVSYDTLYIIFMYILPCVIHMFAK